MLGSRLFKIVFFSALMLGAGLAAPVAAQNPADEFPTFKKEILVLGDRSGIQWQVSEVGFPVQSGSSEIGGIEQIIIAVDTSASMRKVSERIAKEIRKSLPENPTLPVKIVVFNERFDVLTPGFTLSREELGKALEKVRSTDRSTAIYTTTVKLKDFVGDKRTHLIVISDGEDTTVQFVKLPEVLANPNLIVSYFNWGFRDRKLDHNEPLRPEQKQYFEKLKKAGEGKEGDKNKKRRIEVGPNDVLTVVAERSGGDIVNILKPEQLPDLLRPWLTVGGRLYRLTWTTQNPESSFQVASSNDSSKINRKQYSRHW